ncbi:MAG: hypothetical protein JXA54_15250 [Candidatus Heimdallarchaeota archaeon]|nr:hypothetical protein [Candidatus Heimdallarchaeota archaeon]
MKSLLDIFHNKKARAKSKKSIFITIGIIIGIIFISIFLTEDTSFFGIFIAAGILALVVVAMYFWLRAVDDLPNIGR